VRYAIVESALGRTSGWKIQASHLRRAETSGSLRSIRTCAGCGCEITLLVAETCSCMLTSDWGCQAVNYRLERATASSISAGMKLADFLFESGMTTTQLRRALGVKCRSTITRYLHGDRLPNPVVMQRIIEISSGKVQLQDFLRGGNPTCATIITLPNGRKKLVFPWSTRSDDLNAAERVEECRRANDNHISLPLERALKVLEDRARRLGDRWLLDGRPADGGRLVREANRILAARREPLIAYPGIHS
jgi:hypothetical protein